LELLSSLSLQQRVISNIPSLYNGFPADSSARLCNYSGKAMGLLEKRYFYASVSWNGRPYVVYFLS